jgi:glycosyltransferase involved in cell wall biosynthesis
LTRVLFVGPYHFPDQFDSLEVADYVYRDLYMALEPHVEEMWILTGQPVPRTIATAFDSMSKVRLAGPRYAGGGVARKLQRNWMFRRFGRRLVAERGIDVVTNVGSEFSVGSTVAAIGHSAGIRTVVRASGDEVASAANDGRYRGAGRWRKPVDEWRRRQALSTADAVIVMSEPEAARVTGLGVDLNHIAVCPRGVDVERFHPPASRSTDRVRVVFFGRFHRSKGFDVAVEAARLLAAEPKLEFVFAGGAERPGAGMARFAGPVNPKDMPEFLRAADIAIFPSRHEGLPQGMLEAMASGCAAVMSEEVYRRLVPEGVGLFSRLTADGFSTAVLRLARDETLRGTLALAGREYVVTRYDRRRLADRYAEALLGLTDRSGQTAPSAMPPSTRVAPTR